MRYRTEKRLIVAAVVAALTLGAIGAAEARGGGYGWRYGPGVGGYTTGEEVARDTIEAAVKAALEKASKGSVWTSPRGVKYTPIISDSQIIGHLWDDADLSTLQAGAYWAGKFGQKVELVKDGRVVGMIWINPS